MPPKKTKSKTNIIVGKPPSQLNGPYWRNSTSVVTTELAKLPKAKAVSYFKVHRRVHGGSKIEIQYWKTLANGYMIYADVGNCRLGIVLGFPTNAGIEGSTKKEFYQNFKKILSLLI